MLRSLKAGLVFTGALLLGASLGATSSVSPAHADAALGAGASAQPVREGPRPPDDPNRKKEGEPCKTSDECQRHHRCVKEGEEKVCQAPPRPRLPPGAVT